MFENEGFKEATFIQTSRRGGDLEADSKACGVAQRGGSGRMGYPTFTCGG